MASLHSSNHHRHSNRLEGYNYARAGAYFITVCTQNRPVLFGEIVGSKQILNLAGQMVDRWWVELGHKFPQIVPDAFVVMPNHVHGIINLSALPVGADLRVCPRIKGAHAGASLPEIVQWFKTMTTNEYIRNVKQCGWPPFAGKLWQRNDYEHIIRYEDDLNRIRDYIAKNPARWDLDRENPEGLARRPS